MKILFPMIGFIIMISILSFPAYMASSFGFITGWISNIALIFAVYFLTNDYK